MPQHPRDRLRRKQKLEFDCETLSGIPYINNDVPVDTKVASVHENKIIDHIIKNLPPDNDRYYIDQEEGSNTFKILEDLQQNIRTDYLKLF